MLWSRPEPSILKTPPLVEGRPSSLSIPRKGCRPFWQDILQLQGAWSHNSLFHTEYKVVKAMTEMAELMRAAAWLSEERGSCHAFPPMPQAFPWRDLKKKKWLDKCALCLLMSWAFCIKAYAACHATGIINEDLHSKYWSYASQEHCIPSTPKIRIFRADALLG